MQHSIDALRVEILASHCVNARELCNRADAIWLGYQLEIKELCTDLDKAKAGLRIKDAKIGELERKIANLNKVAFGTKSDRNPTKAQPQNSIDPLEDSTSEDATTSPTPNRAGERNDIGASPRRSAQRNRNGRGRREFPKNLKRRDIYMDTPDKKCPCGCGGSVLKYVPNETLEVIPARYYVAVRHYPKFRCRRADKIVGTRFIPRVFPQTTMSNSVLANAIFMRFGAHLPWYRQERLLSASGIRLNRSTLMKWSNRVATQALLPLHEMMMNELLHNSTRLFVDETTIPMLAPGTGRTKTSYLFAVHRDDRSFGGSLPSIVLYYPSKTRAMYRIHELLGGVTAIVQTDAYAGYGQLGRQGTSVEAISNPKCWAHARRHFTDEYEFNKTEDARKVIQMIAELYAEEEKIRGKPPLVREAHRRQHSVPILDRLEAFLRECAARHLSRSGIAKAVKYAQRHWPDLVRFVDDGRIDLDTNAVERMFKPSILLRKNALFIGSDEGAEAWGILSSIVETCKLNGVSVEPYLKWVLDQIAAKLPRNEYDKLLPWNVPTEFLTGGHDGGRTKPLAPL